MQPLQSGGPVAHGPDDNDASAVPGLGACANPGGYVLRYLVEVVGVPERSFRPWIDSPMFFRSTGLDTDAFTSKVFELRKIRS
jgi:hypothetical protein